MNMSGELTVTVQFASGKSARQLRDDNDVTQAKKLASRVMVDVYGVLNFANMRMKIDAGGSRISQR
jgi:hypothetical protein